MQDDAPGFIEKRATHLAKLEREFMLTNRINPPKEAVSEEVDFDTDDR